MTTHIDPIEAWAGIAEAAGINTLAACIALVREAGYTVTKAKPKAVKAADFRVNVPRWKTKKSDRTLLAFTFADGTIIRSYAMREGATKAWCLGSAARSACDKWRYRNNRTTEIVHLGPIGHERYAETAKDRRGRTKFDETGRPIYKALEGSLYGSPIGPTFSEIVRECEIDTINCPAFIKVEAVETDNVNDTAAGTLPTVAEFNLHTDWYQRAMPTRERMSHLEEM